GGGGGGGGGRGGERGGGGVGGAGRGGGRPRAGPRHARREHRPRAKGRRGTWAGARRVRDKRSKSGLTPSTSEGFPLVPSLFFPLAANVALPSRTLLRGGADACLREPTRQGGPTNPGRLP